MRLTVALTFFVALAGCSRAPTYLYGQDLSGLVFHPSGANVGVHPDQSVLIDPNNPFARNPPNTNCPADLAADCTAKWALQAEAGPPAHKLTVAAFYSWATLNAAQPGGETQFYAAIDLQAIFEGGKAEAADLPAVSDLAIRGYQAVLDYFPDSVTYDATGTVASDLATPSYQNIVRLGGTVKGGWVLVQEPSGAVRAVRP
jgi:hypothetical protein